MFVHDFVHVTRPTSGVEPTLTRGCGEPLRRAIDPSDAGPGAAAWIGPARHVRAATIVPMRWAVDVAGVTVVLDADLEIAPIGRGLTRLGLTGRNHRPLGASDGWGHELRVQAGVEGHVRSFLARLSDGLLAAEV